MPIIILMLGLHIAQNHKNINHLKNQLSPESKNPNKKKEVFKKGQRIPYILLKDIQGNSHSIPDKYNDTLLLLFSTTCKACIKNMGNWKQLVALSSEKNQKILGISKSPVNDTVSILKENKLYIPVVSIYNDQKMKDHFKFYRYPQTILIDSSGRIKNIWIGVLDPNLLETRKT